MPQGLTMADMNEIERIFGDAIELPEELRPAFVASQCADNPQLLAEVESLLRHVPLVDAGFLAPPEVSDSAHEALCIESDEEDQPIPERIGPYRVLERIGAGGMGVVYKAQQPEPLGRIVAIKVMRRGARNPRSMLRFRLEQHALAVMQHPSIARVFDAGATDEGQPYIVMEHIAGVPITPFCVEHRCPIELRLQLMIQACEAIQHAHQKGIIHRDIKASNVLVTREEDRTPRVKIIDFSIAKPTRMIHAESNMTRHGELLGSLNSMAPEQLDGAQDIDTRADIYALGGLLYELLTALSPVEWTAFNRASPDAVEQAMRSVVLPSVRLKQTGGQRSQVRRLRGDLDWITLKALAFDRAQRYGTAAALADDLRAHLMGLPVSAGPPSRKYRLRKFVSRNRTAVTSGIIVFALLTLSLIGITTQTLRMQNARRGELDKAYAASIAACGSALLANDRLNAQRFLDMAPGTHQGWEARHLRERLDASIERLKTNEMIFDLALSADAQTLAFVQGGKTVAINLASGQSQEWANTTGSSLQSVAVSPDGQTVAIGGFGDAISLYRLGSNEPTLTFNAEGPVLSLSFSHDGASLAAADGFGVGLWDLATRQPMHQWAMPRCWDVAFLGESKRIAALSSDCLSVFDPANAEAAGQMCSRVAAERQFLKLGVSRDGALAAIGESGGLVRVWNLEASTQVATLRAGDDDMTAVGFSGDGRLLACASRPNRVHCWSVADWKPIEDFNGHTMSISALALNRDGSRMYTASTDRTLRTWDVADATRRTGQCAMLPRSIVTAAASNDGRALVAATKGGAPLWVDLTNARGPCPLVDALHSQAVAISADSRRAAVAVDDRLLFIDDPSKPAPRAALARLPAAVGCAAFDHGGSRLATAAGSKVQVWDVASGALSRTFDGPTHDVRAVVFSPDGSMLACAGDDGSVWLWDANAGGAPRVFAGKAPLSTLAFSADGRLIAAAQVNSGVVRIWSAADGREISTLFADASVSAIAFVDDDKRLLVGTHSGDIQVWRWDRPDVILCLWGHGDWVTSITACDDGRVFSTSRDGAVRVWNAPH